MPFFDAGWDQIGKYTAPTTYLHLSIHQEMLDVGFLIGIFQKLKSHTCAECADAPTIYLA
jgi:hypothetical protein